MAENGGNLILNKLKSIDSSRQNLKNILENKGLNVSAATTLNDLIGNVPRLNLYENIDTGDWEGVPDEEEPDYYKGDEDWRNLIDIDEIMSNDSENYQGKAFFLIRTSDNTNMVISNTADILSGFQAYKFSDGDTVTTTLAHTWDTTKDFIDPETNERFRYIIAYTSSTTQKTYFNSRYFIPEAIVYWQGTFDQITVQDFSGYAYQYYNTGGFYSSTYTLSTAGPTNGLGKCPKYFEAKQAVTTNAVHGLYSFYQSFDLTTSEDNNNQSKYIDRRLRTCILDCKVKLHLGRIAAYNLEYFVLRLDPNSSFSCTLGGSYNQYTYIFLPIFCKNNKVRTYFKIYGSNAARLIGSNQIDNGYMKIIGNLTLISRMKDNSNFSCKVTGRVGTLELMKPNTNSEFQFPIVGTVNESAFNCLSNYTDVTKTNKLRIDTITGNANNYAFAGMYLYPKMKFEGTGSYTLGQGVFAYTTIKELDLTNSGIESIDGNTNNSQVPNGIYYSGGSYATMTVGYDVHTFGQANYLEILKLPNKLKTIPSYALYGMESLKQVVIGTETTTIGAYAFASCEKLATVVIGTEKLTSLGDHAFTNCYKLESIAIPGISLLTIGNNTFQNCYSLYSVNLPENLQTIPEYCFSECISLKLIEIPEFVNTYSKYAFNNCASLTSITQKNNAGPVNLRSHCFDGCGSLQVLPNLDSVTTVEDYVFRWCGSLTIKLPKRVNISLNDNAYKESGAKFLVPEEYYTEKNINISGATWTIQSFLDFIDSLPDRTDDTTYTIVLGADLDHTFHDGTYTVSFYSSMVPYYVKRIAGGKLIFVDSPDEETTPIPQFIANKNWSVS